MDRTTGSSRLTLVHLIMALHPNTLLATAGWPPLLYADWGRHEDCVLALLAVQPEAQLRLLGELLSGPYSGDKKVVRVRRSAFVPSV